jgi:hypothetical protein
MTTMKAMTTPEMEPPIKQRFSFAASSFARMYGPSYILPEMYDFCEEWARGDELAPLDDLHHVDRYFRKLWQSYNKQ